MVNLMKKYCIECGKEYNWEEGQLNWGKAGPKKGRGVVRSDLFCSYNCGIKNQKRRREEACIKKYGVKNPGGLKEFVEKALEVRKIHSKQDPEYNNKITLKKKQTTKLRYGDENFRNIEKSHDTQFKKTGYYHNMQSPEGIKIYYKGLEKKYGKGIKNVFQVEEIKNKCKETNLKRYGVEHILQNKNFVNKAFNTKKVNNNFKTSNVEEKIYELLCKKFNKVERQYISSLYPFHCDFYIVEKDLYIEYQGLWTHGKKPFENTKEDLEVLDIWKEKSKTSLFYSSAIENWTIRDSLKRETANKNNLNWLEFFTFEEFLIWYEKI